MFKPTMKSNAVALLPILSLLLMPATIMAQLIAPGPSVATDNTKVQDQLDAAMARWSSLNVTNYDYRYSEQCECLDSITRSKDVQVRNETIVSVEYAYNWDPKADPVVPPDAVAAVKTVPELYNIIQQAIDGNAASIQVQFNRNYGHPAYINIDYDDEMIDEEFMARIESLIDIRVTETRQREVDKARALWDSYRILDYNYYYRRSCFCMYDYTKRMFVEVRNNTVDSAYFAEDSTKASEDMVKNWLKTIDDNFDMIQSAIDRQAHSMRITYNDTYGYPMQMSIDYVEMMADEELYVSADGLDILAVEEDAVGEEMATNTTTNTTTVTCEGPNGETYLPGDTYTAADGCNSCVCSDSGVSACSMLACAVEPPAKMSGGEVSPMSVGRDPNTASGDTSSSSHIVPTLMAVLSGAASLMVML